MKGNHDPRSRRTGKDSKVRTEKKKKKYHSVAKEVINQSDIVLEILHARFIKETRNVDFEKRVRNKNKKLIYVFNKSDLSDMKSIKEFNYLVPHAIVSCKSRKGIGKLRDLIKIEAKKMKKDRDIRVGVIGYPNTGKSSIINLLSGRGSAKTSPEGGYTKGMQKIRFSKGILLIDSPGVISKPSYSSNVAKKIAEHTKIGSRSYSQIRDAEMALAQLMKDYSEQIEDYYGISAEGDPEKLIEELGKEKGYLKKGGVDEDRTSRQVIKDWQEGKIKT